MTAFAGAARSLALFAILLLGGSVTLYWLALQRQSFPGWLTPHAARIAIFASGILVFGLGLNLAAQFIEFRDPRAPVMSEALLLLSTSWGRVWQVQLVLAAASLFCSVMALRSRTAWGILTACALTLCGSPSFASHAMASERWRVVAVSADVVHLLAGSAWIGGLIVLFLLIGRLHRQAPTEAGSLALSLVRRFSPVALSAAVVIVATGLVGVFLRLTALHDLWTSAYGRLLLLKIGLFLGVVAGGYHNWQRATPRLARSGDARVVRGSMRSEIAFALLLIAVTAFLVATPPPSE